jgi:hypothetical protein
VNVTGAGTTSTTTTIPAPSAGGWSINGTASLVTGGVQLTPNAQDQAGTAFWPTGVSSAKITADFDATIGGGSAADGLTFLLAAPATSPTAVGLKGGGLGYSGITGTAIALDTFQNPVNPSANFIGIATGWSATNPDQLTWASTSTAVPALRTGTHHVTVTVLNGTITVQIDGTQYLSTAVTLPGTVLVGFSGGTGGNTDTHTITNPVITIG